MKTSYGKAICEGFRYLLRRHSNIFVIGQGVWSPWYVGNSMTDLDKEFGRDRVMDCPVSEAACTGIAVGASLCGYRPIVVHPRMDFMVLASDAIVNQAAKWSHMLGGRAHPAVTIRGIINRGGEQGAQHSQALHAWYAHIPGLRVVMPATPQDARDLLISSVLCDDPVIYIDDRWLYEWEEELGPISETPLSRIGPMILRSGTDITVAAAGYSTYLALKAADLMVNRGILCEVIDLRVLNPFNNSEILRSVKKTGRLCVIDGGWKNCGLAGEIIASAVEETPVECWKSRPLRITLPDAPAPTSRVLENKYYPAVEEIESKIRNLFEKPSEVIRDAQAHI